MDKPRARCEITAYTNRLLSELRGRPKAVSTSWPFGISGGGATRVFLLASTGRRRSDFTLLCIRQHYGHDSPRCSPYLAKEYIIIGMSLVCARQIRFPPPAGLRSMVYGLWSM